MLARMEFTGFHLNPPETSPAKSGWFRVNGFVGFGRGPVGDRKFSIDFFGKRSNDQKLVPNFRAPFSVQPTLRNEVFGQLCEVKFSFGVDHPGTGLRT